MSVGAASLARTWDSSCLQMEVSAKCATGARRTATAKYSMVSRPWTVRASAAVAARRAGRRLRLTRQWSGCVYTLRSYRMKAQRARGPLPNRRHLRRRSPYRKCRYRKCRYRKCLFQRRPCSADSHSHRYSRSHSRRYSRGKRPRRCRPTPIPRYRERSRAGMKQYPCKAAPGSRETGAPNRQQSRSHSRTSLGRRSHPSRSGGGLRATRRLYSGRRLLCPNMRKAIFIRIAQECRPCSKNHRSPHSRHSISSMRNSPPGRHFWKEPSRRCDGRCHPCRLRALDPRLCRPSRYVLRPYLCRQWNRHAPRLRRCRCRPSRYALRPYL